MAFFGSLRTSWTAALCLFLSLGSLFQIAYGVDYVQATDDAGDTIYLDSNRRPALYTQNFGDCLGSSIINVTRFDVAYYKDNMTVLFHLQGNTDVRREGLMMFIGVYAYGEARFDLTFNPCNANIASLCPMNASIPIEANGIIPVAQSDVAGIPPIALAIPDFEGQAILRIFANSTKSEIGCYSAVITNGASFSHPSAVGTILGIFTMVAIGASLVTAIYGESVPTMRKHYAHSLSVLVVFSVFHHIFFSSALSVNWPSVLAAFWNNYAWTGGMIYSESMQDSINQLIGSNKGNTSMVGAASSGSTSDDVGGGYSIQQIYKRSQRIVGREVMQIFQGHPKASGFEHTIAKRGVANVTSGYPWYGSPSKPGLPLPGNYSGFAGTLAQETIPASNAFMTGFLWLLILVTIVAAGIVGLKWLLEGLNFVSLIKHNRLAYFRAHWQGFTALAVLRTLLIAFFMMIFLTIFQFSYKSSVGVTAIAAIVFLIFFAGMFSIVGYACFYRLRFGRFASEPDRLNMEKTKGWANIPWYGVRRESQRAKAMQQTSAGSIPWIRFYYLDKDKQRPSVHEDEHYTKKFGWLAARFRRTRWWFFVVWLVYEFIRACFYGGAVGHPMTQVFGLLAVEIVALIAIVAIKPFEGARLNSLMVYMLGFSKITTLGLSAAFHVRFNLPRITTTVIGVVIIVIQGILTIVLLIAITIGAISSYMSVTRNREDFKPQGWALTRQKYFQHIEKAALDLPPPPPLEPKVPQEPYFNVSAVRRYPKIEDEDADIVANMNSDPTASHVSVARKSRANSMHSQVSTTVPFGARLHRTSWSSRDFNSWHESDRRFSDHTRPHTASPNSTQALVGSSALRHGGSLRESGKGSSPFSADSQTEQTSRHMV
ncbi:MAG: hypothetical protein M1812_002468 [Candelaria pacifica]|nr:MAG: hypothetical protein M1812_002468 [Candelaria pacifica]